MKTIRQLPVVIIGGGFAGVTLAQQLEKELDASIDIVVISRDNHLVFTPMLAEVAARTVSPLHVVVAGRQMTKRTRWIAASTKAIDVENRLVHFESTYGEITSIEFGDLVLACGMDVNLNEIPGMAAYALPLKSIEDAFALGNSLIGCFEQAAVERDRDTQIRLLTTVVIGGGFSGVEIAGHLHDLAKNMRRYYEFAEGVEPRMFIVHRGERVIPELQHRALSTYTLEKLRRSGIEVLLNTGVSEVSKRRIHLSDGKHLTYGLLAGTVGNTASTFVKDSGLPLEGNRLRTTAAMQVENQTSIWALGDCALVPNGFDGKPSPPTAQFALRQARQLAANIRRSHQRRALSPFYFRPQGLLASIGQRNGVAEVYGFKFSGVIAWFFWRAVYLMKMPSVSRKVGVAMDWVMNSLFSENLVRIGDRTAQIRKEHHVSGDVIYSQGEPSRTLYLVEKGIALVRIEDEEAPVARLQQGDHFGISAVEEHETERSTTVTAESALDLIAFDRPKVKEFSHDMLTRELARLLEARRARESWQSVIDRFPELKQVRVRDTMFESPSALLEHESLKAALRKLSKCSSIPVVDENEKLTGVCTRGDVIAALAKNTDLIAPVSEFFSPASLTLSPDQFMREATAAYLRSGLEEIPVINSDGRLIGMFSVINAALRFLEKAQSAQPNRSDEQPQKITSPPR